MSLYGIRPTSAPEVRNLPAPGTAGAGTQARVQRRPGAAPPATATTPAPASAPASAAAMPAHPPAGTDPDLWSVLTNDERAHFARLGAMGPLTYGRVLSGHMAPPAMQARGGRVDVRA
jgi:hypothetical protein